jgi:predicted ABC-type ATPase
MMNAPRVRMFAGPNGSGKSTLNTILNEKLLGMYINADEIEKKIKTFDFLDLGSYDIDTTTEEIYSFFMHHPLIQKSGLEDEASLLSVSGNKIIFFEIIVNSYFASVCADFIRHKLLELKVSFTFETVMSSEDKVLFLKKAQDAGYRTYLYFVTTQDPAINISRVQNRVSLGGHNVPEEKIVSRYYRSMKLLSKAIKYTNRAYIFDNSNHTKSWIAQIDNTSEITYKSSHVPQWFGQYLLEANKVD